MRWRMKNDKYEVCYQNIPPLSPSPFAMAVPSHQLHSLLIAAASLCNASRSTHRDEAPVWLSTLWWAMHKHNISQDRHTSHMVSQGPLKSEIILARQARDWAGLLDRTHNIHFCNLRKFPKKRWVSEQTPERKVKWKKIKTISGQRCVWTAI